MVARNGMQFSSYEGEVPQWKVNLALGRIRAFGFPKDDWQDVLQDVVVDIMKFRFDAARANGAKESTALCAVVNNRLMSIMRGRERLRDRTLQHAAAVSVLYEDRTELELDVRMVVASLAPFAQAVCTGLARGDSRHQIALALGCGWYKVDRAVEAIRARFEELDLEDWLCA
jgi:hypothetical protein